MNNQNFYTSPTFPGNTPYQTPTPNTNLNNIFNTNEHELPLEQSYIENILRLNRGKKVNIYMTYPDSNEWRDKIFSGIIEQSGRDHIILSDPATGKWSLLLMIYVDYINFDEKINYSSEFIPK